MTHELLIVVSFDIQGNLLIVLGDLLCSSISLYDHHLIGKPNAFGFEQKDGTNKKSPLVVIF